MLTLVGFGAAKLRRPIRLPSWVGFAVAVELPAGLLRLFLIGQPFHSRTRIYPPCDLAVIEDAMILLASALG